MSEVFNINYTTIVQRLEESKRFKTENQILDLMRCGGVTLTIDDNSIKSLFFSGGPSEIESLYFILPEKWKKKVANLLAEKIINFRKGMKKIGYTYGASLSAKLLKEALLEQIDQDTLVQCMPKLNKALEKVPQEFIIAAFKKLKGINAGQQEIYNGIKKSSLKKQLLPYIPTAAVALSDKSIEIRDKAKRALGLKTKNIDYRSRFKKAVREKLLKDFGEEENLKKRFEGFTKNKTCELKFKKSILSKENSFEIRRISMEWERPSLYGKEQDDNYLYFGISIEFHAKKGKWDYHQIRYQQLEKKYLKLPSCVQINEDFNETFQFRKSDYQIVIDSFVPLLTNAIHKAVEEEEKKFIEDQKMYQMRNSYLGEEW